MTLVWTAANLCLVHSTILITVLTNSFTSISSNAREEHQFLFAINTISLVKNDSLFSYVAPGNIFAWAFMPLRYCMSMRQFVMLNRYVIKITHFPLLFSIYIYERYFLAPNMFAPTDLVENPGRSGRHRTISFADPVSRATLFSPSVRFREESIAGYQKDRALDELFRRVPGSSTLRTQRRNERRRTQNAVRNWMDQSDGRYPVANFDPLETRLSSLSRERPRRPLRTISDVRSANSDPADFMSIHAQPSNFYSGSVIRRDHAASAKEPADNTDADGDDELVTNDEDDEDNATNTVDHLPSTAERQEDYFATPRGSRFSNAELTSVGSSTAAQKNKTTSPRPSRRGTMHNRTLSTNTILYAPEQTFRQTRSASASFVPASQPRSRPLGNRQSPVDTPPAAVGGNGRRSPRRSIYLASRPRKIMPQRDMARTAPNLDLKLDIPARKSPARRPSSVDLDTSSVLNAAMIAAEDDSFGAVPSSFATQMAMATGLMPHINKGGASDSNRLSRLMLAKMKTLEESLGDVVREMRILRSSAVTSATQNSGSDGSNGKSFDDGRGGRVEEGKQPRTLVGSGASSGGSARPALIEVATSGAGGWDRRPVMPKKMKTAGPKLGAPPSARPPSRKSKARQDVVIETPELSDSDTGAPTPRPFAAAATSKGKGKAVYVPSAGDESDDGDEPGKTCEGKEGCL